MAERLRLGELLVETGLLTREQLDLALERQREDKRRLGELLVAWGMLTEAKVTQVLSQQLSVPWVSLAHIDFSRPLLDLVSSETAQKYGVVPIYVRRGKNRTQTLYVAMQDPTEADALEEIGRFSGLPVRPMIAPPSDIRGAIRAYYLGLPPEEGPSEAAPSPARPPAPPARPAPPQPSAASQAETSPAAPAPRGKLPSVDEDDFEEVSPDSAPVESRDVEMPRPRSKGAQRMVTLTLLDGTQITLPASGSKRSGEAGDSSGLTARDLIEALRAHADGADATEVLGENVSWERVFAALLSLLLKKHLIHDWEFVRELKR